MTAEPSFALSGPTGTVLARGIETPYAEVAAADAALRCRAAPVVVGALPFDPAAPCALHRPTAVRFGADLPRWPRHDPPTVTASTTLPPVDEHRDRVAAAVERLRSPGADLHKVVLARALRLVAEAPFDATTVLQRLIDADPAAYAYLVDLSPAGPAYAGETLVGASPELLVARRGDRVTCRPFAGSAARHADPDADRAAGTALARSAKNRHEHQLVIDVMVQALAPLCTDLRVSPEPTLHATDSLWHLSTEIDGRLREGATSALDLARALHPTPAVGGVPTADAAALIGELEGDRGFYAGAVGWCDADGDGVWVVSIRCARLSADRRTALAHSGGGIVAESDPADEVNETTAKFRTILTGLGVQP
ncbi:isochorismate synthase [Mycolicibacterium palauense]|uniref:isochorismate synthase n=1 Tax=Mycolicibacterium palauense TaxID=2034511 RepID=UPI000BFF18D0|nr:isochorismate synthase [Mycolicibacterium palauense]